MVERRALFGRLGVGLFLLAAVPGFAAWQRLSNTSFATATPTLDRLAAPPTVASPGPADLGAQVYWLNCQPCHGDRGQGLTDEWRAQYPPEDQNCWDSGCHGKRPYEGGFKLPPAVPALIGPEALARFDTAQTLYAYISTQMPFQAPASLTEPEYWQLTAYLIQAKGIDAGRHLLDATRAAQIRLKPLAPTARPTRHDLPDSEQRNLGWWLGVGILVTLCLGLGVLWQRRHRRR